MTAATGGSIRNAVAWRKFLTLSLVMIWMGTNSSFSSGSVAAIKEYNLDHKISAAENILPPPFQPN